VSFLGVALVRRCLSHLVVINEHDTQLLPWHAFDALLGQGVLCRLLEVGGVRFHDQVPLYPPGYGLWPLARRVWDL